MTFLMLEKQLESHFKCTLILNLYHLVRMIARAMGTIALIDDDRTLDIDYLKIDECDVANPTLK